MARKSKRMALYEAIRQGQVNIAKGLESGKLRSDGKPHEPVEPAIQDKSALLRTTEKSFAYKIPIKIWAVAAGAVGFVILLLLIGIIVGSGDDTIKTPAVTQPPGVMNTKSKESQAENTGFLGLGRNKTPETEIEQSAPMTLPSSGNNVIVIQGISASRRDELDVLGDFFAQNGVPTEIYIDRSGYALLITTQGFEKNPETSGTAGNRLLKKIQLLGSQYPEKTGDTKFGQKPFQDAYGYKIVK